MTPKERRNPKILDARRKRRIAAGSGTKVEDINKLLKMHRQMADMMKTMGRNGGMLNKFLGRTGGGPSEAEMQSMQAELAKLDPKALEQLPDDLKDQVAKGLAGSGGGLPGLGRGGLPGLGGGLPRGLPGLGGGMPKFPGLPGKKR
jgi:signal recognition particle subunit SRP54